MSASAKFDPIAMEVFSNRLLSITEEMGNTLIRSSFSSNIKERKDCSVALFDDKGRLIAQAAHIPVHLGSLSGAVEAVLQKYTGDIHEGDAFLSNDAYLAGGSHSPDLTVINPVFCNGRLEFFVANVGHHTDVGGPVPGSTAPHLRTVWEEGLRIPTIKIAERNEVRHDVIDLLAQNTREPEDRVHDLHAQIATNKRGERLLQELATSVGLAAVKKTINDIMSYTEQRLRNRIRRLPGEAVSFEEYMDDDGLPGGDPMVIKATVQVKGDELFVDFAGSGPQSRGAYNIPINALRASVYFAVKAMLDPALLPNNGMFAPIHISAPEGTITNPRFPAAVGSRATTAQRCAGAVIGALSKFGLDGRRMASSCDVMPAMVFSGPSRVKKGQFVYLETLGGGAGGRDTGDGMDGVQVHITNTSNLPTEALEVEYPLLVEEYTLIQDSGGAGKFRGGMGIARQIRSLDPDITCSVRCDGALRGAAGLDGGMPGGRARVVFNHGRPTERASVAKVSGVALGYGESVRLETPGGGGFGVPSERSKDLLDADVWNQKVSAGDGQNGYQKH